MTGSIQMVLFHQTKSKYRTVPQRCHWYVIGCPNGAPHILTVPGAKSNEGKYHILFIFTGAPWAPLEKTLNLAWHRRGTEEYQTNELLWPTWHDLTNMASQKQTRPHLTGNIQGFFTSSLAISKIQRFTKCLNTHHKLPHPPKCHCWT